MKSREMGGGGRGGGGLYIDILNLILHAVRRCECQCVRAYVYGVFKKSILYRAADTGMRATRYRCAHADRLRSGANDRESMKYAHKQKSRDHIRVRACARACVCVSFVRCDAAQCIVSVVSVVRCCRRRRRLRVASSPVLRFW